ncbi:Mobile element protein [Pseudomonas chlororaphis]|uniref:Mobile element protein n=2 Tax=Pseudomonas chlororaphis TaxID=587753 RepID=A0A3G7TZR3_9PSED|nr:Mobile element protein [Pseudomonas chlororaphis]
MRLARALELTHHIASTPNAIEGLDALPDPSLVEQALAPHYVLPHRREERVYPRAIRLKSPKYPIRNKNASQLN